MKVCFATSECTPFAKAGGLADVSGALPGYLSGHASEMEVRVILPLYDTIDREAFRLKPVGSLNDLSIPIGSEWKSGRIWRGLLPGYGVDTYFVESDEYFGRPTLYSDADDEAHRFIFFQLAVLEFLKASNWIPDILHANDWPTGLLPALVRRHPKYLHDFAETATVFSIHNIGYQGLFEDDIPALTGLPENLTAPYMPLEYYGKTSFLKAAIAMADAVSTVSPTYAREITQAEYGRGLEGVVQARGAAVSGILNGIDTDVWNPETDNLIPHRYAADSLDGKKKNRTALLKRFGLKVPVATPVLAIIARLTDQKGFHLFTPVMNRLIEDGCFALVVLGNGDRKLERRFSAAQHRNPDRVGTCFGYSEELSHFIEAGADLFLMPSIYEPCGLNQMYSLRYGTVPIVRRTGGLADTVLDIDEHPETGTGFVFDNPRSAELRNAIRRACAAFRHRSAWREMQQRGMKQDFSWESSAVEYVRLYDSALAARLRRGVGTSAGLV
jgi:starch synthase